MLVARQQCVECCYLVSQTRWGPDKQALLVLLLLLSVGCIGLWLQSACTQAFVAVRCCLVHSIKVCAQVVAAYLLCCHLKGPYQSACVCVWGGGACVWDVCRGREHVSCVYVCKRVCTACSVLYCSVLYGTAVGGTQPRQEASLIGGMAVCVVAAAATDVAGTAAQRCCCCDHL